jgi:hypothetical protein
MLVKRPYDNALLFIVYINTNIIKNKKNSKLTYIRVYKCGPLIFFNRKIEKSIEKNIRPKLEIFLHNNYLYTETFI